MAVSKLPAMARPEFFPYSVARCRKPARACLHLYRRCNRRPLPRSNVLSMFISMTGDTQAPRDANASDGHGGLRGPEIEEQAGVAP